MSNAAIEAPDTAAPPTPGKADPETLALRARPTRAIRFKRGVIVSLIVITAAGVVGTTWFALEPHALHLVSDGDDHASAAKVPSDTLNTLPASYANVPKLGPPLPGDLGRPILDRQRQLAGAPSPPPATNTEQLAEEARQRRFAELKAARESGLLVQTGNRPMMPVPAASPPAVDTSAGSGEQPAKVSIDPDRDPNGQQRKADFVATGSKASDTNPYPLAPRPSPFTLSAGSVISASLITGLRSDLPGLVTAQVTQRVFDSATGGVLLIPQGTRLIGKYDSVVAFGQSRALIVWQRIVFPDGSSIRIDNAPASDPSGYAGVADKVDYHSGTLLKGVALSTMLGVGAELQFSGRGDLVDALRQSAEQNVSRAGDQLTSRSLSIQPTITVRPGAPIRLLVNQDLVLKPWTEE